MNKITKNILSLALITGIMSLPLLVGAQWDVSSAPAGSGMADGDLKSVIEGVITTILGILSIIAILGFVIAGVLYVTAGGNAERVEQATNWLKYSIIGIVVALVGYVVVKFVGDMLTT